MHFSFGTPGRVGHSGEERETAVSGQHGGEPLRQNMFQLKVEGSAWFYKDLQFYIFMSITGVVIV
eukprot:22378-Amphidinium_carterae.1